MARAFPPSRRQSRRVVLTALAAFAAFAAAAQIPAEEELDEDDYVLRSAPLPAGAELMAQVRSRLPAEPVDLSARVSTHDPATGKKVEFRAEAGLRFGEHPPAARYALTDAFGAVREQLDLTWGADGKAVYRISRGPDLKEAPGVDPNAPIDGLEFAWSDLSLSFLWWEGAQTIERDRTKLRSCYVVEIPAPPGTPGLAKARLWIDRKETFVLRAQLLDAKDELVREVEADSIEQIGDVWMVKDLEIKSHPSRRKTRIVVEEVKRLSPVPAAAENQEGFPDAKSQ